MAKKNLNLRPLGDRVIVRPLSQEDIEGKRASGIILPDTIDKEKPEQGEVLAIGEGKKLDDGSISKISVKVGDRVVFSRYGFDEVKIGEDEYYILKEENILAVVE